MGEVRRKVETYSVDMICPMCGTGIMRPTGAFVVLTSPPQYPHECPNCGYVKSYLEVYPRIEYKVVEDDES